MKDLIQGIQAKLAEATGIKYIDEDWGQLDDYSAHPPVKWPCCLIDVQGADFSNIARGLQESTVVVVLNFANVKLTNSSSKAPIGQQQNAWSIHDIIKEAHDLIQGFSPVPEQGSLIRTSQRKVMRDDGVQQHRVFYSIGMHSV